MFFGRVFWSVTITALQFASCQNEQATNDRPTQQIGSSETDAGASLEKHDLLAANVPASDFQNYVNKCNKELGTTLPKKFPNKPESMKYGQSSNGWRAIKVFDADPKCLASAPDMNATLFQWDNGGVSCFYLYRYSTTSDSSVNGVLCFKKSECKVCAFDLTEDKPGAPSIDDLQTPKANIDRCADCHMNGLNAPKEASHDASEAGNWYDEIWKTCNEKTPEWIVDSDTPWPGSAGKCPTPATCQGCHGSKWNKSPDPTAYCGTVFHSAFDGKLGGSMHAIGPNGSNSAKSGQWDPVPTDECNAFLGCMECESPSLRKELCEAPATKMMKLSLSMTGSGKLEPQPKGASCGDRCFEYEKGTAVKIMATPTAPAKFTAWSGACSGASPSCSIVMSGDKSVTGQFTTNPPTPAATRQLKISRVGTGVGAIKLSPQGTSCGNDCFKFPDGTTVTLNASAVSPNQFSGWTSSSSTCKGQSCSVKLTSDQSVTAGFSKIAYKKLQIIRPGSGTGQVSPVSPTSLGESCGSDCFSYPAGTSVTLKATADSGSTFLQWTGNCTTSGQKAENCQFLMNSDITATVTFQKNSVTPPTPPIPPTPPTPSQKYKLTTNQTNLTTGFLGQISRSPESAESCVSGNSTTCKLYAGGQTVRVSASATLGGKFCGWSGACNTTASSCDIRMDGDKSVTAKFTSSSGTCSSGGGTTGGTTGSPTPPTPPQPPSNACNVNQELTATSTTATGKEGTARFTFGRCRATSVQITGSCTSELGRTYYDGNSIVSSSNGYLTSVVVKFRDDNCKVYLRVR